MRSEEVAAIVFAVPNAQISEADNTSELWGTVVVVATGCETLGQSMRFEAGLRT